MCHPPLPEPWDLGNIEQSSTLHKPIEYDENAAVNKVASRVADTNNLDARYNYAVSVMALG
jgi:hypothetical protein